MKWLRETFAELAKKVSPKHAFILLVMCIICTSGYFILDRILDYKEAIDLDKPKRVIEKPESSIPEYVEYKYKTLSGNMADNINKQE